MRIKDIEQKNGELNIISLPGIGDILYSWYKLIHFVRQGYKINLIVEDKPPQRASQLEGCLEGLGKIWYVEDKIEYDNYRLVDIDLLHPGPQNLFQGLPVLHPNSFVESGMPFCSWMPRIPIDYHIPLLTSEESKIEATYMTRDNTNKIVMYTSSYENNMKYNMFPDPKFWYELAGLFRPFSSRPVDIFITGAEYDRDLSEDTAALFNQAGCYHADLFLDQPFQTVIELIRRSDLVITYESGIRTIADNLKIPCIALFRDMPGRYTKYIPYSGLEDPEGTNKRFFPFLYSDTLDEIQKRMWGKI